MSSWWQLDPARTMPPTSLEPEAYLDRVLETPVLARCRDEQSWLVDPPMTMMDWLASGQPLSTADVDLHLSMLFPPVRPQGYLELRYLDAQPADEWIAPLALVSTLFADDETVDQVIAATTAGADRWQQATEVGLADDVLRGIAGRLWAIAEPLLVGLGLGADINGRVIALCRRRLVDAISPATDQLSREGSS
jgi:glutamate--cysteine ligase